MNRIAARITEKVINSAQEFTEISEVLPQKLKKEWSSFKEEVIEETDRLKKSTRASKGTSCNEQLRKKSSIQSQIDNLRSKVIDINKNIEEKN